MLDDTVQRRISIVVYDDIPAIHAWLVWAFGLGAGRLEHDEEGWCYTARYTPGKA